VLHRKALPVETASDGEDARRDGGTAPTGRNRRRHPTKRSGVPRQRILSKRYSLKRLSSSPPSVIGTTCKRLVFLLSIVLHAGYAPDPQIDRLGIQGTTGRRRIWTRFQQYAPVLPLSLLLPLARALIVGSTIYPTAIKPRDCMRLKKGEVRLWRATQ
jgi:hypothetical protein